MSVHTEWGTATTASVRVQTRRALHDEIGGEPATASHALVIATGNGDGVVLEGTPAELATLAGRIARAAAPALARWAEMFGDGMFADHVGGGITCNEVETTYAALALIDPEAAAHFRTGHIASERAEGDDHEPTS